MYLGGALRRTPFFAIRRPGRNAYFYRLARIVFGVGGRGTGWRESFFCWWAGESSRGTAKTPPLQSGADAASTMIGIATNGHALWPYAAKGVPSRGNRGRWAWTGWRESFWGGGRGNLREEPRRFPRHPFAATNAQTVPPSCRLPMAYRRHLLPRRGAPNRDMAVASYFGVGLFSCVGWRFIHRNWTLKKMGW